MVFKRKEVPGVNEKKSPSIEKVAGKIKKTTRETENLVSELGNYVGSMDKRDGYISAQLVSLKLAKNNNRFGQAELLENMPTIIETIRVMREGEEIGEVPNIEIIYSHSKLKKLSASAEALYSNCADLANSFISSGDGYADTPPKVYPAINGFHNVKVGHRRIIAYLLAEPITDINSIDVILDKGSNTQNNQLAQTISRATENASRVGNTLAEQILAMSEIYKYTKQIDNKKPNKALISRQTGIERTKVGRLIEIIEQGGAENLSVLEQIHNNKIEDATAVHLLYLQPECNWPSLVDELLDSGTDKFREKYRIGNNDKTEKNPSGLDREKPIKKTVIRFKLEGKHAVSAEKLLAVLTDHKSDWLTGIDINLSPLEKLKQLLDKLA